MKANCLAKKLFLNQFISKTAFNERKKTFYDLTNLNVI